MTTERITPDEARALALALNYRRLGHRSKPLTRTDVEVTALALNDAFGIPLDQDAFDAAGMPLEDDLRPEDFELRGAR